MYQNMKNLKDKLLTKEVIFAAAATALPLLFQQYGATVLMAMPMHYPITAICILALGLCFAKDTPIMIAITDTANKAIETVSSVVDTILQITEVANMGIN